MFYCSVKCRPWGRRYWWYFFHAVFCQRYVSDACLSAGQMFPLNPPQSGHGFSCGPTAGTSQCGEFTGAQKAGDGSRECSQSIVSQSVSSREPLILLSTREYISPNDPSADTHISSTSFWWWGSDSCGFWWWDALRAPVFALWFHPHPPPPPPSSSSLYLSFHPSSLAGGLSQSWWVTLGYIYRVK